MPLIARSATVAAFVASFDSTSDIRGHALQRLAPNTKLEVGRWVRETADKFVCGELVGSGTGG